MQSSEAVTVSSPAMRNRKQMSRISSRQPLAVHLGVEQGAQEVVSVLASTLVEHPFEEGVDGVGGLLLQRLGLGMPELVAGEDVGPDHAVLHLQERGEVPDRETEHGEEDL
ncbi:MAG: hypothetical protein R2726_00655 [Acidimicrobiales bacterium]